MTSLVPTLRRWWVLIAGALVLGGLVSAVALSGSSEPTSAPPGDGAEAAGPATPAAAPSSGPTGTPEPGSLAVVQTRERPTARPVPFQSPATFRSGLALRVTRTERVAGVARGPGEIAGPAVRISFQLRNDAARRISLESVVMSASYGDEDTPAVTLTGPGAREFRGSLAPGRSVSGRYVFAIPPADRDDVLVVASYTGSIPAVAFTGSVR